ncbi:MinD/ParA family ATP-binding protein [Mycolicibacterium fortuitum]|uniref:MinD/ParA family ATP-binding protein n=1 Tax=Mycolicibacterium fortuitum TaxID=1766 RepID=UPI001CE064C0|nr:MinD/ParA family protein [Mycolicibacterium fortuitum]MCA4727331.1 MinD/ParA family protein [Mycolicibacterium fortuitum]
MTEHHHREDHEEGRPESEGPLGSSEPTVAPPPLSTPTQITGPQPFAAAPQFGEHPASGPGGWDSMVPPDDLTMQFNTVAPPPMFPPQARPQYPQRAQQPHAVGHAVPVPPTNHNRHAQSGPGHAFQGQRELQSYTDHSVPHGYPDAQGQSQAQASQAPQRASESMAHVNVRSSAKLPPERGWRRWLLVVTRINLGLSADEVYERELHAMIRKVVADPHRTNFTSSYKAAVLGLKGGIGKTALTVLLGSVLATVRKNPVLAVDANPDAGNLVERSGVESKHSVAQVVASGKYLSTYNALRAHTSMNEANLEVLAAEDYVDAQRSFSGSDWQTVTEVASPYYPIILADCGTGLFNEPAISILNSVWGLVIVTDTSVDSARQAAKTLDWMRAHGYPDLINRCVVVINHTKPGSGSADIDDMKSQFARHVGEGRVFEVPYDRHIAEGVEINLSLVSSTVRRRVVEIAAAMSENFDKPRESEAS